MDILLLIYLAFRINLLAKKKGQQERKWAVNLVVGWIFGEMIGAGIGIVIFGKENMFSWALIGFGVALTIYFLIYNHLSRMSNINHNENNNNDN